MSYRFTNRNDYPVYLPTPRGGQCMFRPGEGTTDQWYSRFVGHGQLVREETDVKTVISKAPVQKVRAIPQAPTPSFPDVETKEYRCSKGVWFCKLCTIFRTGSSQSLQAHIQDFHNMPEYQIQKPMPKRDADEQVVVTSKQSATQVANPQAPMVGTMPRVVDTTPVVQEARVSPTKPAVVPPKVATVPQAASKQAVPVVQGGKSFPCPVEGCGKVFTTNVGLSAHIRGKHPEFKKGKAND